MGKMDKIHNLVFAMKEIAKVSKSIIVMLLFYAILSSVRTVIDLILIKYLVDYALSPQFQLSTLIFWLIGYFVLNFVIRLYLNILLKRLIRKFEMRLTSYTYEKLYKKILCLDYLNYDKPEFYDKLHRAMDETKLRYFMVCMQFFSLLTNCVTCSCIFTIYRDPVIIVAVFFCVAVYLFYYFRTNKKQYHFNKKEEPYDRLKDYLDRIFYQREYAEELRVSPDIKNKLLHNFSDETDGYLKRYNKYLSGFVKESAAMTTIYGLVLWMAGLYTSAKLLGKEVGVGDFLVMLNIVSSLSDELIRFFKTIPDIYQSALYMGDIREVLGTSSDFNVEAGLDCNEFKALELRDVYFKYDTESSFAIRAVDFVIRPNEIIAVVGLNGSGKSTLMDILTGLIRPDRGMVMLNGIPYQQYNIDSVRKLFGVVFQDFQIYEVSVAENILMREVVSEEDAIAVRKALQYAGLYDKIRKLEMDIHTVISEGKENSGFSGGELQKIAVARAYASKAPILLFDEPTSNLDVYATRMFYEKMFGLKRFGKTVLFSTHKLYYTMQADRIFYIENGAVQEKGSHRELMGLDGAYAALYRLQSHELFDGGIG